MAAPLPRRDLAFYNLKGEWDVENHGVTPDIEVEYDPALVRSGHDPQLEKAVQVVMTELEKHPAPAISSTGLPELPQDHFQQFVRYFVEVNRIIGTD